MTIENKCEFTRDWLDENMIFMYSPSDSGRILVYGIDEYEAKRINQQTGEEEFEPNRFILEVQPTGLWKVVNSYFMPSEQQRERAYIKAINTYSENRSDE